MLIERLVAAYKPVSVGLFLCDIALLFFKTITSSSERKEKDKMQITLNQKEIEKAIISFVGNQGIAITGKHVNVTLVAGRGPNGMSASIDISNDDPVTNVPTPRAEPKEVPEEEKPTPKKRGRKKSEPVTEEETESVEEAAPTFETESESESKPEVADEEDDDKPLFGV